MWAKWLWSARNAIGHLNTDELQAKVPEDLVILNELGMSPEVQRRLVSEEWSYSATAFCQGSGSVLTLAVRR
jgi:hypothetical protein